MRGMQILRKVVKILMSLYKRLLLGVLAFILIAIPPAYAFFPDGEDTEGDILVVLKPTNSEEPISASSLNNFGLEAFRTASFAAASGAWVRETYPSLSEASNSVYALLRTEKKSAQELTEELMKDPEVLAVCPNYKVYASVIPNDTYMQNYDDRWGFDYINAPEVWETYKGSEDIYVVVMDSGIDYNNPDIQGNLDLDFSTGTDNNGHGTHVAGIIGAVGNNGLGIAGVNWNVKLISAKALGDDGSGTISDVISAIDYVCGLISEEKLNIRAVNMSFETYLKLIPNHDNLIRFPLWRAFKELDNLNTAVIVTAAGNHGQTVGSPTTGNDGDIRKSGYYVYPASFVGLDNFVSVGALSADRTLADFSNKGATINAPGVNILSTWLQSASRYIRSDNVSLKFQSGTSMAAPYVSGAIALLASIAPEMTAYQLKSVLLQGNPSSTGNVLDLSAAVAYQEANRDDEDVLPSAPVVDSGYNDYKDVEPSTLYTEKDVADLGMEGTTSRTSGDGCSSSITSSNFSMFVILSLLVKKLNA